MSLHIPFRAIPWFAVLFVVFISPVMAKSPAADDQPHLRLICATSLPEKQQVVIASRDAEGKWQELGTVEMKSSLITNWLPAQAGELHLAVREEETLKSICQFEYPADSRRALVALFADKEKMVYEAQVVDPASKEFVQGSMLIFNFSPHTVLVSPGPEEERVEAGQQSVVKPTIEGGGMYRMMVSYLNDEDETVPCYDRQVSGNPSSRDMLFLLPDKTLGLRVLSLPMFGSLD